MAQQHLAALSLEDTAPVDEAFRLLEERKKAANDLVSQKAYAEAADRFRGVVQDGRQQLDRFDDGEQQDGLRGQLEALVATSSNNLGLCYLKLFRHADCVRAINELFRTTHARSVPPRVPSYPYSQGALVCRRKAALRRSLQEVPRRRAARLEWAGPKAVGTRSKVQIRGRASNQKLRQFSAT